MVVGMIDIEDLKRRTKEGMARANEDWERRSKIAQAEEQKAYQKELAIAKDVLANVAPLRAKEAADQGKSCAQIYETGYAGPPYPNYKSNGYLYGVAKVLFNLCEKEGLNPFVDYNGKTVFVYISWKDQ